MSPSNVIQLLSPEQLSLNCSVEGFPLPTITWIRTHTDGLMTEFHVGETRDGETSITVNNAILNSTVFSSFFIHSTHATDTANYTCIATNEAGNAISNTSMVSIFDKSMNTLMLIKLTVAV